MYLPISFPTGIAPCCLLVLARLARPKLQSMTAMTFELLASTCRATLITIENLHGFRNLHVF